MLKQQENVIKRKKTKFPGKKSTILRRIIISLIVSVLAGLFFTAFPVIRIQESCSISQLDDSHILIASAYSEIQRGDLVVFRYDDEILIQRCIGVEGDSVYIQNDGTVTVNDIEIGEDYVIHKQNNSDDIYPYEVPEERYFVLNDDRSNIADSRTAQFGCISAQQVIGKVVFNI